MDLKGAATGVEWTGAEIGDPRMELEGAATGVECTGAEIGDRRMELEGAAAVGAETALLGDGKKEENGDFDGTNARAPEPANPA